MRVLGLDLGSKTLGIAISDSNEKIASMRETYRFPSEEYDYAIDKILEYIDQYRLKTICLGLPVHMNGDLGVRAQLSMQFKEILEAERDVEVVLIDERMTSIQAEKMMIAMDMSRKKRKEKVDSMAAREILQSYLDRKRNT